MKILLLYPPTPDIVELQARQTTARFDDEGENRHPLGWALIGALFFPTNLICLLLESHLCPKLQDAPEQRSVEAAKVPNLRHIGEENQA